MKRLLTIIGSVLLLCCCTKPYEEHWDSLVLDYENIRVAWNSTSVPICIYSDAEWTASIADSPAWASLDCSSGRGVSTIHLLMEENDGFERSLRLDVEALGLVKSISVVQKTSVASPYIEFETASLQCSPQAADTSVCFRTNIPERYLPEADYALEYDGESGWIENLKLREHTFYFNIKENAGEQIRKAVLSYSLEISGMEPVEGRLEIVQEALGGPVLITSAEQLYEWNAACQEWTADDEICLGADIVLDSSWEAHDFPGTFDGCGFSLTSEGSGPLFRSVSGCVKNLKLAGKFAPAMVEEGIVLSPVINLAEGGRLEGIENSATMEITEGEDNTIYLSGICAIALGGEIVGCRNSGRIVNSLTSSSGAYTAGILSCIKGPVTVSGCVNEKGSAGVIADISNNTAGIVANGGIVAAAFASATISDCESSTDIKKGSKSAKFYYAAGIAAYCKDASLTIEDCRHTGRIFSSVKSTYCFLGGILGYATQYCELRSCSNSGDIFNNGENAQAGGLRLGGIVGAPAPADRTLLVSECSNLGKVYNKTAGVSAIHCLGGISGAGNAQGVSVENCLVDCEISSAASDASLARMGMLIGRVNIAYNCAYGNGVCGKLGEVTLNGDNFSAFLWASPESGKAVNVDENRANYYWNRQ